MARPGLVLLLLVAALAAVRLARLGFAGWREQAAGATYGLPGDRRRPLLHGAGAATAGLCAAILMVAVGSGHGAPAGSGASTRSLVGHSPGTPSAAAVPSFATVGHPAGGELLQGSLPAADGSLRTVRVWLPPQYSQEARARFPVVVLQSGTPGRTADTEAPYVFDGFADAVNRHRAVPFVVVAPQASPGTERPCELLAAAPEAVPDDPVLRAAVAARFRTLPAGPQGWETLGVGAAAPCAAAAGLGRPDLYGAAAALSGRYDTESLTAAAGAGHPGPAAPRLLLAAAPRDSAGRDGAQRLRDALRAAGGPAARATVQTSEAVQDQAVDQERVRLVGAAVEYLAGTLPGAPTPAASPLDQASPDTPPGR